MCGRFKEIEANQIRNRKTRAAVVTKRVAEVGIGIGTLGTGSRTESGNGQVETALGMSGK
jgi:hypothetical protein